MGGIQLSKKIDLSEYVSYFLVFLLSAYYANSFIREGVYSSYLLSQRKELADVESQLEKVANLNAIFTSSLKNYGKPLFFEPPYSSFPRSINIVVISKSIESVLARARLSGLVSSLLSAELELWYLSDYSPDIIPSWHIQTAIPKDLITPALYIVNNNNEIVFQYIIKEDVEKEELLFIRDLIKTIYIEHKEGRLSDNLSQQRRRK